jgi:nucleotide-binding universal stress UspA family protein
MLQINRILCPVDLSDSSRHAITHAVMMAKWYKARITALHVCNPVVVPSTDFVVAGTPSVALLTEAEVEDLNAQILRWFGSVEPVQIDVVIDNGNVANRVLDRAVSLPADLIVMGTHGAGGFEHLILGSVAEKVLRKATCPVMTVPPQSRTTSKVPFKRLLCPVDFSESSMSALQFGFSIAQESDAELTILHVFEWRPGDEALTNRPINVPEYRRQLEHDFDEKLHALVPDSVRDWCRPRTRTAHGKAYREILAAATEENVDLIVMGVQGRNALDLMLFGSTTNQVVRRATCPVLTLRA